MRNKLSKRNKNKHDNDILQALLKDPTKSLSDIAKELKSYRQKIWRVKRKSEEEHIIWGYTIVIDEGKLNQVCYIMLMKTKPMSQGLADLLLRRILRDEPRKQNVRVKNMSYVNGEYNWVMRFSTPDHATARKYYDTIRTLYDEYLLKKPVVVDVNICLISEGKLSHRYTAVHLSQDGQLEISCIVRSCFCHTSPPLLS